METFDWLVSPMSTVDEHFLGRGASEKILLNIQDSVGDIKQEMGRISGMQEAQQTTIADINHKIAMLMTSEGEVKSLMERAKGFADRLSTVEQDVAVLKQRADDHAGKIQNNSNDLKTYKEQDESPDAFWHRKISGFSIAIATMIGTAIAAKIPAIIQWFQDLHK